MMRWSGAVQLPVALLPEERHRLILHGDVAYEMGSEYGPSDYLYAIDVRDDMALAICDSLTST